MRASASLAETYRQIDAWVHEAATYSVERDPQLDIASALPRPPTAVAVKFVRRVAEPALAAD